MPQTSDELREIITRRFGSIDDWTVWKHLESRGFTQDRFVIRHPTYKIDDIPQEDWECIIFLFEEWDWAFTFPKKEAQA